jgi:hypothetical protein
MNKTSRLTSHPKMDVRYTRQLKEDSTVEWLARNAGDVVKNIGVGVGNTGVAAVKVVEAVFDLNHHTRWLKPMHKRRKLERKGLGLEPTYGMHRECMKIEAERIAGEVKERNKSPQQKKFDAQVRLFDLMSDALTYGSHNLVAYDLSVTTMNKCVMDGVRELRNNGVEIAPEELEGLEVNGLPGIYPEVARARNLAVARLPGTSNQELRDQCKAAIARRFIEDELVPEALYQDAQFPTEADDQVFIESSSQQSIER